MTSRVSKTKKCKKTKSNKEQGTKRKRTDLEDEETRIVADDLADETEAPPFRPKRKKKSAKGEISNENTEFVDEGGVENDEEKGAKTSSKRPKREKKQKNLEHESKGQNKALRYLQTWKTDREGWKFSKCRQIWLIQNAFDSKKITDKNFDILLEYLGSIQGRMRKLVLDKALKNLDNAEKWNELKGQKTLDEIKKEVGEEPSSVIIDRSNEIKILLEED